MNTRWGPVGRPPPLGVPLRCPLPSGPRSDAPLPSGSRLDAPCPRGPAQTPPPALGALLGRPLPSEPCSDTPPRPPVFAPALPHARRQPSPARPLFRRSPALPPVSRMFSPMLLKPQAARGPGTTLFPHGVALCRLPPPGHPVPAPPVKSPACALAVPESSGPCEQRRVLPNFLWRQTLSRRVFLATWLWSAGSEPLVTDQLELILSVLDEFKF